MIAPILPLTEQQCLVYTLWFCRMRLIRLCKVDMRFIERLHKALGAGLPHLSLRKKQANPAQGYLLFEGLQCKI